MTEFGGKKFIESRIKRLYEDIEREKIIIKKEVDYRNALIDVYFERIRELKKELEEMEK